MADSWVSAHIFHQAAVDRLLLALARDLSGSPLFFLRYWEGGDHVRVRVRPGAADAPRLRAVIEQRCREHFARYRSTPRLSQEQYAAEAALLARREDMA